MHCNLAQKIFQKSNSYIRFKGLLSVFFYHLKMKKKILKVSIGNDNNNFKLNISHVFE